MRNSWLTVARKRDFASLAASGARAFLGKNAFADHTLGNLAACTLEFDAAVRRLDRGLDPGEPAQTPCARIDRLVDQPGAILAPAHGTCLHHARAGACADQRISRAPDEGCVAVIREGDPARPVAAHDHVELRLDDAAMALLALGEFPQPVLLDLVFRPRGLRSRRSRRGMLA